MREDQLELNEKVNEALQVELKNARARYGDKFSDKMEFRESLFNEIREMESEYFSIDFRYNMISSKRIDKKNIRLLKDHAIKCAMEAIQVACICTKYLQEDK